MDAQATFSCSFTQSDLSPVTEPPGLRHWPAPRLLPQQRQHLAVQVLARPQPRWDLAREREVSRKCVASDEAVALADDVALLVDWFRHDILTIAGPCYTDRCELYDFVVVELRVRVPKCPHRLEPICRALENQRDDL